MVTFLPNARPMTLTPCGLFRNFCRSFVSFSLELFNLDTYFVKRINIELDIRLCNFIR